MIDKSSDKRLSPEQAAKLSGPEKSKYVQKVFDRVARRYDKMNDIISLGATTRWRIKALRLLNIPSDAGLLDVGTGSGMLPAYLAKKRPDVECTGIDISQTMLDIARERVPGAKMLRTDVTDMPFEDCSFDIVTSCFVYRNLSNRDKAVREMYRVLKPGGNMMLLDTFAPRSRSMMRPLMSVWLRRIVPLLVSPFAKASDYRYLAESILAMTDREEIQGTFEKAGFEDVCLVPLEFDTACALTAKRKTEHNGHPSDKNGD